MSLKEKIEKLESGKEILEIKLMNARMNAEAQALMQFYGKIAKEDGVTVEEAIEMCDTIPQYSLGRKLQIYMVRSSMDLRHKKEHLREFMANLTPEEREIYERDVKNMNLGKMVKEECRRATKR
jgi:hypothetical protein